MKQVSTIFLKLVVFFIGLVTLAVCIFILPSIATEFTRGTPQFAYLKYPFLICLYASAIGIFSALYQSLKLLTFIENGKVFSGSSVRALKKIKYSAAVVSILFFLGGMPVVYLVAELDDAPGMVIFGMAFVCVPVVIATFAAILQRLLQEAADIKAENDFTI